MKTEEYYNFFLNVYNKNKKHSGYSEYGSNIMPILEKYKDIKNYEDRKFFQDALENLLKDKSEDIRSFGVSVCLGFYIFRDSI